MYYKVIYFDFSIYIIFRDFVNVLIELFIDRFYLVLNIFSDNGLFCVCFLLCIEVILCKFFERKYSFS